jgi:hypothetical protein
MKRPKGTLNELSVQMTSSLIFAMQESIAGRTCSAERHDWTWCFVFGKGAADGCTVTTTSWWRIISEGRIAHAVEDDGQQFGLPRPVDGIERSNTLLAHTCAVTILVKDLTSDLRIDFQRGLRLDIMNSSCGCESWQANFRHAGNDVSLISCGGGEMNFVKAPVGLSPQIMRGRKLPPR